MSSNVFIAAAAVVLVGVACSKESAPPPATVTTSGAGVASTGAARTRIVTARCERARTCAEQGKDPQYDAQPTNETDAACYEEATRQMEKSWATEQCPRGIQEEKVTTCVQEIRNEKCGTPFENVTCRLSSLCVE
jgi:hypothetical protein